MLKAEQQAAIAKLLKIDYKTLEEAIKAETETDISIPEGQFFTPEEIASRDKVTKAAGYKDGKEAGEEIVVKSIREKHGLEFEGKDPDKLADAFKAKVLADAKLEPQKAIQEKETIIANLRQNITALEQEKTQAVKKAEEIQNRVEVLRDFPAEGANGLKPAQMLTLMEADGYSYERTDSGIIWKKGGEVIRDGKTQQELKGPDVVKSFITESGWENDQQQQQRHGRGGGNSGGATGKPTKLSEAEAAFKAEGKHTGSAEFTTYVSSLSKENPNFDMEG